MSTTLNIPYSAQYVTLNREGHEHPPPSFGAPTLVWHLAISPHWPEKQPSLDDPLVKLHADLAENYEETRIAFFEDVNRLLEALQRTARFPVGATTKFNPRDIPDPWPKTRQVRGNPFYITSPGSIRFTLWWSDANASPSPEPAQDALRVKVHASAHRDYVTLSFYLDASKPWNHAPLTQGATLGARRARIFGEVDRIRSICEPRMDPDSQGARLIDRPLLPEHGVSSSDAASLLAASRYLYDDLWEEFCRAMDVDILKMDAGRVFANFRGLVISTDGLPEGIEERRFPGSSGAEPFPRFKGNGGIDHTGTRSSEEPNEANAVVKAFWPFIRRATRQADRKEFVACGVMNWRALYVTSLNCPPAFDWAEEARSSDTEVPAGHLFDDVRPEQEVQDPVHYLLITKGAPHRRQVGRIVDRINSMGTMRLIALRDYNIVRDASTQIQVRGLELDTMMRKWSIGRAKIRAKFDPIKKQASRDDLSGIQDQEDGEIQKLADNVESDLIELSAALDEVGLKAVSGLHFRINRSRYYVAEFESMLISLGIGNIDTWVSYDQFVRRGLKPAFEFIDGVGRRLLSLRARLQTVLEGIETSALVKQSSATRLNTAELRNIAKAFAKLQRLLRVLGLLVALAGLLVTLFGYQGVLGRIGELLGTQ
jgi:hypothetical protein